MKKHSLKDWLIAVRPWSFPASAMPVIVTLAYLYWAYGVIEWANGLLGLVGIVIFHASGNAWRDYFDFERGVDRVDTFGVKTLTSGQFMPLEIRNLAIGLMVPAVMVGLWLVVRTGLPLLWIGVCGALCSLLYPWLKYRAFGDFVIFVAYAILPTLGISYITMGKFLPDVWLIIVPVGLITVAILHANNTRDIGTDVRARISTLAMRLGVKTDPIYVRGAFPVSVDRGLCSVGIFSVVVFIDDSRNSACNSQCTDYVAVAERRDWCHIQSG